jgi:hypothetical protein
VHLNVVPRTVLLNFFLPFNKLDAEQFLYWLYKILIIYAISCVFVFTARSFLLLLQTIITWWRHWCLVSFSFLLFAFSALHLEVLSIVISSSPQIIVLFNLQFCEDMSDIDEKQLVLYAQMANIVNFILQWPEINIKEIAENFSKVF